MSHIEKESTVWEFIQPHLQSPRGSRGPVIRAVRPAGSPLPVRDLYREELMRRRAERRGHKLPAREVKLANPIVIDRGTPVVLAPAGRPLVRSIIAATISASGVSHGLLVGPARSHYIMVWRQAAMYLAKKLTGLSYPALGIHFHRDHTTVLHACSVAEERDEIGRCVDAIKALLK